MAGDSKDQPPRAVHRELTEEERRVRDAEWDVLPLEEKNRRMAEGAGLLLKALGPEPARPSGRRVVKPSTMISLQKHKSQVARIADQHEAELASAFRLPISTPLSTDELLQVKASWEQRMREISSRNETHHQHFTQPSMPKPRPTPKRAKGYALSAGRAREILREPPPVDLGGFDVPPPAGPDEQIVWESSEDDDGNPQYYFPKTRHRVLHAQAYDDLKAIWDKMHLPGAFQVYGQVALEIAWDVLTRAMFAEQKRALGVADDSPAFLARLVGIVRGHEGDYRTAVALVSACEIVMSGRKDIAVSVAWEEIERIVAPEDLLGKLDESRRHGLVAHLGRLLNPERGRSEIKKPEDLAAAAIAFTGAFGLEQAADETPSQHKARIKRAFLKPAKAKTPAKTEVASSGYHKSESVRDRRRGAGRTRKKQPGGTTK